ncbi:MAG: GerMN domain-containing protein [Leptolyngbyaceae cyanobacterium bins.302]|nr:GerMN domain-containing protein [Leptolyngbyaceae cyanobacterium bins.302]
MNQTKLTLTGIGSAKKHSCNLITFGVMLGVLLLLNGCNGVSREQTGDRSTPASVAAQASPSATETPEPSPQSTIGTSATPALSPSAANTVSVKIYHVDDQCEDLVSETVEVAGDRPIESAIGKVLDGQGNADFKLTGYRVSVDNKGVATVDFRLSPDSPRQFVSLSACEQLSLFGSLEETLMQNPQWQIKSVQFTERGEKIVL